MSSMKKEISVVLAFVICVLMGQFTAFAQDCDYVRHHALRLHIMANSNEEQDQKLKLLVRDQILQEYAVLFGATKDKQEAVALAKEMLPAIVETAQHTLQQNGEDPQVTAQVTQSYFTTRVYEDFTLPAGNYESVQITLGSGEGKNWWCVMYPPMCVPTAMDAQDETVQSILEMNGSSPFVPKFAIMELWEQYKQNAEK